MRKAFARFIRDQGGATAIEYGPIAAGVTVAIIAMVGGIGGKMDASMTNVKAALE